MNKQEIYDFIKEKNIWHEITEHKAVFNMAELAEKTEYSHEFIRRIEAPNSKKNFSIDAVSNIANALDIDINLLFEKREDKEGK